MVKHYIAASLRPQTERRYTTCLNDVNSKTSFLPLIVKMKKV